MTNVKCLNINFSHSITNKRKPNHVFDWRKHNRAVKQLKQQILTLNGVKECTIYLDTAVVKYCTTTSAVKLINLTKDIFIKASGNGFFPAPHYSRKFKISIQS